MSVDTSHADDVVRINETVGSLQGRDYKGGKLIMEENAVVRRLTPMECERLQGYPDHWTDIGEWTDSKGKKHKDSDSPRYKALGNSIALPFWEWMAGRMVEQLGTENPTMASLFDGIGGFPLVYSRNGCKPVWASEIEEFPIAVTKIRFPEGEE
jgi:DNA (cytosine-5)-methyltransferase 1